MDYRKPAVFGENWSESRYQVLPYFNAEKVLFEQNHIERVLDLGCANGWNMSRFNQYKERPGPWNNSSGLVMGLDMIPSRVQLARHHGPAMIASGLEVPARDGSFDLVYIQHVLHHIGDVSQALAEAGRLLRTGGFLFLVETVEDNPLIHWGRKLYPQWLGDEINASFNFLELQQQVARSGFTLLGAEQYSVFFWIWEILPDQFPVLEKFTPIFVTLEKLAVRFLRPLSAHSYLVAQKL